MGKIFTRKQFSDYLGENRAILDVITNYVVGDEPVTPVQSEFITFSSITTDQTTFTFEGIDVGQGGVIVLSVYGLAPDPFSTPTVTVNGLLTVYGTGRFSSTSRNFTYMYYHVNPGGLIDVVVDFQFTQSNCVLGVHKVTGVVDVDPYEEASNGATGQLITVTFNDLTENSVGIMSHTSLFSIEDWINADQTFSGTSETIYVGGADFITTVDGNRSVQVDISGTGQGNQLCGLVWRGQNIPPQPSPTPTPTPSSSPVVPTPTPSTTPTPTPSVPSNQFFVGQGFDLASESILLDPSDDSIFVGGRFTFFNNNISRNIVKISSTGIIDSTFVNQFSTTAIVIATMAIDGSYIWLGGDFNQVWSSTTVTRLMKVNKTTGDLYPGWVVAGGANNGVTSIAIDSGGKAIITGSFTSYGGASRTRISRVNTDGAVDTTLTFGTGFNNLPRKVLVNNSGNYVVVGTFTTYNGITANRIIEIDSTTGVDTGLFGTGFDNQVADIQYDSVNDIYYVLTEIQIKYQGGTAGQIHEIDGSTGLILRTAIIVSGGVQSSLKMDYVNDHLYISKSNLTAGSYIRGFISTLTADTTFNTNLFGLNGGVNTPGRQSVEIYGQKPYFTGNFTSVYNENYNHIVRTNSDGTNNSYL